MNLLQDTLAIMKKNKRSVHDVQWVGSRDGTRSITWQEFAAQAQEIAYYGNCVSEAIDDKLVVVGSDWWLERHDYDGMWWWEYKTLPQRKEDTKPFSLHHMSKKYAAFTWKIISNR